jgi:hypothetical protein
VVVRGRCGLACWPSIQEGGGCLESGPKLPSLREYGTHLGFHCTLSFDLRVVGLPSRLVVFWVEVKRFHIELSKSLGKRVQVLPKGIWILSEVCESEVGQAISLVVGCWS